MKKIIRIVMLAALFVMTPHLFASDFTTIYKRMYNEYLTNPSKSAVEGLLKKMNDDGSFPDINYQAKDGSPRKHVLNLISLAAACENPENAYYSKDEVRTAYLRSLEFWIDTNNQSSNWWYRYIPYPKELSKSVILMSYDIKQNKKLFEKTIKYLRWSFENSDAGRLTGANGADIVMGSLTASVLTENDSQMMEYKNKITELLTIQAVEGIQPDYLFAQHCGKGRQLYFTNYGKEFVNSVMFYLEFCNGTKYQTPGVELLQDLFINGVQWIFFNKHYDPNNSGRYDSSDQYFAQIKGLSDRIQKLNCSRKAELKKACNRITGENSLEGNRMFWRFDYMINRRSNYMVSTRMSSTRTVGSEAGNGDGEYNYYSGNGTNYLFVTAKEYAGNYFKKFNNRQFPGITAEQDNEKLPIPNWGENAGNGNVFAGGVSDSTHGACAMILDRRGLQAHKAWFYFDTEYVCLGAGITETGGKADVYTTINQTNPDGTVQFSQGGKQQALKGQLNTSGLKWVYHGKIAYFSLDPAAEFRLACDTSLFSLNINHGTNPQNKTYAYLVVPDIQSASEAAGYQPAIKIISNSVQVQAVQNEKSGQVEIIFYEAGTLKLADGESVTVDFPCAVLWNKTKNLLHVANPRCESENPKEIHVSVKRNNQETKYTISMPDGVFAGRSVMIKLK